MGVFSVTFELGDLAGRRFEPIEAIVDTGASYTCVPTSLLTGLGVVPSRTRTFVLADGQRAERDMGEARARWDGLEVATIVVFGDEGTDPLLGAYTLEGLGLAVDPENRRLVPTSGYLL